jgi:hypothetical protein
MRQQRSTAPDPATALFEAVDFAMQIPPCQFRCEEGKILPLDWEEH